MKKLEPIIYDDKLSAFNVRHNIDEFDTNLYLEDYDWMRYRLWSCMPTKAYGDIRIEFEYFGANISTMKVKTEERIYEFTFDSDLFKEHIIKFLQKHIAHWKGIHAFRGIEEVVNFYNAVITDPNTVEEKSRKRRRKR